MLVTQSLVPERIWKKSSICIRNIRIQWINSGSFILSVVLYSPSWARNVQGIRQCRQGWGGKKIHLVHSVTSFCAVHQVWCGTIFFLNRHDERMGVGDWREEGMVLFCMMRYCHTGSIKAKLLFTAALWLVKIWSVNCCKKPSSAVLNSLNLQENHWQATTRKNSFGRRVWYEAKTFFSTKVNKRKYEMQKSGGCT